MQRASGISSRPCASHVKIPGRVISHPMVMSPVLETMIPSLMYCIGTLFQKSPDRIVISMVWPS